MSLAKQVIDIPIVGGVEGNTEDPLQTRLERLENGVYRKRGGISKRFGTRKRGLADDIPVGDTVPVASGGGVRTLAAYADTCLEIVENKIYSFSDAVAPENNGKRVYRDKAPETVATYDVIASQVQSYAWPDVAYGSGFYAYAYNTERPGLGLSLNDHVFVTIDDASGATILDNHRLATAAVHQRIVYVDDGSDPLFICVYYGIGPGLLFATFITVASLQAGLTAWSTPVDVGVYAEGATLDMVATAGVAILASAPGDAPAGFNVTRIEYDAGANALTFTTTPSTSTAFLVDAIAVNVDTSGAVIVAIAYRFGGNTRVDWEYWDTTPAETEPATIAWSIPGTSDPINSLAVGPLAITNARSAIVFTSQATVTRTVAVQHGGFIVEAPTITNGELRVVSKPWLQDERGYVALQQIGTRGGLFICEVNPGSQVRPVATVLPRVSEYPVWPTSTRAVSSVVSAEAGAYRFATHAGIDSRGSVFAVDVAHNTPHMVAESNGLALISGGVPSTFDGTTLAEVGFLIIPAPPTVVLVAGGGSLSTGSYQYALVREWVDSKANIHRGAPSFSNVISATAGDSATITFEQLALTTKQDDATDQEGPIANVLYRTVANGTTFYRITPAVPTDGPFDPDYINDPTSTATITVIDSMADATLLANEPLYTTGAGDNATALSNVAPPSASIVLAHKNRFWLAGTDDDSIWYSKTLVEFEGPAFADELTIGPFDGGRVTALGSLDDLLVIFKQRGIWVVQGDGGDDNGQGSTLTEPRRISADTGCVEKRSVVITPAGLMFLSERGIYLVDRALALAFIGEGVQELTQAAGTVITSGVLVPRHNHVRFTVTVSASTTLVYDYLNRAWSTARYYDDYEGAIRSAASAALVADEYRWITRVGQEYGEDETTFLDVGTEWVTLTVETAWIKLTGSLNGYQRVWRAGILAERKTSHDVTLRVGADYKSLAQAAAWTSDVVDALTPERLEIRPIQQRCSAIRFRFQDGSPTIEGGGVGVVDTGEGATLDGVTLEYGVLQGKNRGLAANQKGQL